MTSMTTDDRTMDIVVIGLGGVGSALCHFLSRYLHWSHLHKVNMTLVDGDSYEEKNGSRQEFRNLLNKAISKAHELKETFYMVSYKSVEEYVTKENAGNIITENSYVFLCVDNHKSRNIVNEACRALDNVTLISGGNEMTDGNVQIYIRKNGEDMTPDLGAYHPEIARPRDKHPNDMSCEELAKSSPQLYFTNLMVAVTMCCAFHNLITNVKNIPNEVFFDIQKMSMVPTTKVVS